MNEEKISHLIDVLMHQNLYVVDKGTKEHSDYVVGGTEDLKRELINLFKNCEKTDELK